MIIDELEYWFLRKRKRAACAQPAPKQYRHIKFKYLSYKHDSLGFMKKLKRKMPKISVIFTYDL